MRKKGLLIFSLCLGFLWVVQSVPLYAQKAPKTLTLLHSNNFNGETDACPS